MSTQHGMSRGVAVKQLKMDYLLETNKYDTCIYVNTQQEQPSPPYIECTYDYMVFLLLLCLCHALCTIFLIGSKPGGGALRRLMATIELSHRCMNTTHVVEIMVLIELSMVSLLSNEPSYLDFLFINFSG